MKRFSGLVLLLVFGFTSTTIFAVDGGKAQYIGGTVSAIPAKAEGPFATNEQDKIVFTHKGGKWELPYAQITGLEYGQKAGRRIGAAVVVSPVFLLSKKRKHFLTIAYADSAGNPQSAVFELGKDIVRTTLAVMETRSGKQIEYQDEEAKKAGR